MDYDSEWWHGMLWCKGLVSATRRLGAYFACDGWRFLLVPPSSSRNLSNLLRLTSALQAISPSIYYIVVEHARPLCIEIFVILNCKGSYRVRSSCLLSLRNFGKTSVERWDRLPRLSIQIAKIDQVIL